MATKFHRMQASIDGERNLLRGAPKPVPRKAALEKAKRRKEAKAKTKRKDDKVKEEKKYLATHLDSCRYLICGRWNWPTPTLTKGATLTYSDL